MNILLLTRSLADYDAVSNDVEAMYNLLCEKQKHNCKVYAEHINHMSIERIKEDELAALLGDTECLVIYHHSIYWERGEQWLKKAKGKIVIRYHNITPPEYFEKYSSGAAGLCDAGRRQTERLARSFPDALWLCASKYNACDITEAAKEKIFVCPPFNKTEQWINVKPDQVVLNLLSDPVVVKLLFVGRNAPNKGHGFLIDVVYHYTKLYNSDIVLWMIGDTPKTFDTYLWKDILCRIDALGLRHNVKYTYHVSDSKLLAYYMGSDFFITASEHEGFMVPIAEAQHLGLPVIARNKAAVPETLGDNQVVLGEDPASYAAAVNTIFENREYYDFLKQNGERNFKERFSYNVIASKFEEFLSRI